MIKHTVIVAIIAAHGASLAFGQASKDEIVDLSHVPQIAPASQPKQQPRTGNDSRAC